MQHDKPNWRGVTVSEFPPIFFFLLVAFVFAAVRELLHFFVR